MDSLTLTRPDDWHLHFRDGDTMRAVVPQTARQFARAIVMPNLAPPVTTTALAAAYRDVKILDDLYRGLRRRRDGRRSRVSVNGHFYHALENSRYGDCGLVGSAVAHSLSSRLSGGEDGDLRLLWDGERHVVRRVTFGGDDADGFL